VPAGRAGLLADQRLEPEVAEEPGDPDQLAGELPPGAAVRGGLVVDLLVPRLQDAGDADREQNQDDGAEHGQRRHRLVPGRDQRVDVMGGLGVEPQAVGDRLSGAPSRGGVDDGQEREKADQEQPGKHHGTVHEVDGAEPGPERSDRTGLDPRGGRGALVAPGSRLGPA